MRMLALAAAIAVTAFAGSANADCGRFVGQKGDVFEFGDGGRLLWGEGGQRRVFETMGVGTGRPGRLAVQGETVLAFDVYDAQFGSEAILLIDGEIYEERCE